jgi:aldose 1-epimerase
MIKIQQKAFGKGSTLYTLQNKNGLVLEVTNFGARIVRLSVPTTKRQKNIVLGFDSAEEYAEKDLYFGATIGRVAGRIKKGTFSIDEQEYQLEVDPIYGNVLHGGASSFEERLWSARVVAEEKSSSVIFTYVSPAGENGFPGRLTVSVQYTLNDLNEWLVAYSAVTDQPTLFNPTNHVYFNLSGDAATSIAEHELFIDADHFAVVAEDTTATGEIRSVSGTPFDFRRSQKIKQVFETSYQQNLLVDGLDHPFLFNKTRKDRPNAILSYPETGISVELYTDQPAVVIFTGHFGSAGPVVSGGKMINHGGITLETQVSPGAVEFDELGSIILRPEEVFKSKTIYKICMNADG